MATLLLLSCTDNSENQQQPTAAETTVAAIQIPEGFRRVKVGSDSFGAWLRRLPLKPVGTPVRLFNGSLKSNQQAHYAVIHLDVGSEDLQQCADAVMRLRAEYLYNRGRYSDIHFNFTSGHRVDFARWVRGERPMVQGKKVHWQRNSTADSSYASLRSYLTLIFRYAGSASLSRELRPVADISSLQIGDVWIKGGYPGHAVIVMDVATHPRTGEKLFLLAQSYMPAQDIHILLNPSNPTLSPWYSAANNSGFLTTPEWTFATNQLMRFVD